MSSFRPRLVLPFLLAGASVLALATLQRPDEVGAQIAAGPAPAVQPASARDRQMEEDALQSIARGRQTFRYDTFGDQAFWGDTLHLNDAIAGAANGGVGPGLSPRNALALGLKVDSALLSKSIRQQLAAGAVDLREVGRAVG